MFQAARKHLDKARKLIATAKVLSGFSKADMREYLRKAKKELTMAELYIK